MAKNDFLTDVQTLRKRARQHIEDGAVAAGYAADRTTVLNLLNDSLGRSHAEYVEGESLTDMIQEDLVAERIAIDSYRDIIQYLGDNDSTTRRMMEGILAVEEELADDSADLLAGLPAVLKEEKSSARSY